MVFGAFYPKHLTMCVKLTSTLLTHSIELLSHTNGRGRPHGTAMGDGTGNPSGSTATAYDGTIVNLALYLLYL